MAHTELYATADKTVFPSLRCVIDWFKNHTILTSKRSFPFYCQCDFDHIERIPTIVGDAINITVNFSEAVSLSSSGSMTVTLETGSTDRTVMHPLYHRSATSASGTYTVQTGDVSSDLTVKSIAVSGTISDATDQAMVRFFYWQQSGQFQCHCGRWGSSDCC